MNLADALSSTGTGRTYPTPLDIFYFGRYPAGSAQPRTFSMTLTV
jgi:hypothetical protein